MAIEDHLPASRSTKTGHPPSRVRKKIAALALELQNATLAQARFGVGGGATLSGAEVLTELAEAQAEWTRLDDLRIQARLQEQHIAKRLAGFVDFIVLIRMQLQSLHRKPRRSLTSAERILVTAKLRETRKLRGTMGRRQRKRLKA